MCLRTTNNMAVFRLFIFSLVICVTQQAKILGIFPTPAASHFTLGFSLMRELADRGHEVTMISPYPQKAVIANYTDVAVESMGEALDEYRKDFFNRENMCFMGKIKFLHNMAYSLTEKLLSHDNFQEVIRSRTKFDLVIIEYFLSESLLGVGKILDAPVVLFSSLPSFTSTNNLLANPAPSSFVPNLLTHYTGHMSLSERFVNLAYNTFDALYKQYHMFPLHDKLLKKYIYRELDLEDVMHTPSLILLNSHPSISEPVPHVPNMIEIGGFHIKPQTELPSDLQSFMDKATEGVVIFSMGSNLKSSDFDEKKMRAVLNAFRGIKERVVWKFDAELEGLPKNVKIMKWLPQQEMLAHVNTKAFISHGGMLSTIEAVYYGVPVIGIPVYGDQKMNIAKAEQSGYAISIPFSDLSEEKLSRALAEILHNPKYANNAKTRSNIMKDQIVEPMDLAVYWIEYAIRHKGSNHLQSPGVHLSWFKRNMIDIIIILTIIEIIFFLIFYYIFKHIIHHISRRFRRRGSGASKKYQRLET